ncbi:hypothetical protein KKB43_03590 [Patescibacteria group bacterium]|nr:hypothetical protein [Patescibacteria group bacterium]MBU4580074.1 hypothetical protein [Patescibacteria group bacterium]
MNIEVTTKSNYISNLSANSSSAMANDPDFDYKFEKWLNEEIINEEIKKVKFDRTNGFLSIIFIPYGAVESSRESFIGCISDEEAEKMQNEIALFKKSFDDDLNRRNKILLGR